MKKKHSFLDSPAYKSWVLKRDRAAEDILNNARRRSADIMRKALTQVLWISKQYYTEIKDPSMHLGADRFEVEIKSTLRSAGLELEQVTQTMRRHAYILSKASEAEIIARLLPSAGVKAKVDLHDLTKQMAKPTLAGGNLAQRIRLYMDRLSRKIVSQAQMVAPTSADTHEFLLSVSMAFPKRKRLSNRRVLRPKLLEADPRPGGLEGAQDFVDEEQWKRMLDDYSTKYVPQFRGPEAIVGKKIGTEDDYYAWEYEADIVNDFVGAVRDGQVDAAQDNGVTDFVWIAIVDDKTDACCLWRDGLLTSEIEKQLDEHTDDDESCDLGGSGLVPPLHFNCRCTLAPATDEIPEKPTVDYKSFDEWLET